MYKDVIVDSICSDIKKARDNAILASSIILTLSAIDAMAFLSMPSTQKEVQKEDYIGWVDKYMKTAPYQPYQYKGIDLYGARCGMLHRYGMVSALSEKGKCKVFGYHNGSEHSYNPNIKKDMVMISVKRFTNDFFSAVEKFLQDIGGDSELKLRVDSRIVSLFVIRGRNKKIIQ
ncbi:MAG: hypothetical protein Q8N72_00070 [Candidatus Omnitrophota bacterium]|nr:hypothetical protein [Candidatus Omnitrophota bacterium]